MKHFFRGFARSRYSHLALGLLVLYGVSYPMTCTSRFEKITDSVRGQCLFHYEVRRSSGQKDITAYRFYEESYKNRLNLLAQDLFDPNDKKQMQAFFLSRGLVYDAWKEKDETTYLLARIIDQGSAKAEIPGEVSFSYYILGEKEVPPYLESLEGKDGRIVVSLGEETIYIHKDSIDHLINQYFEWLWTLSEADVLKSFHCNAITWALHQDLKELCEDVFVKRLYRNKGEARKYFLEEGFKVFLPTIHAMGAKMSADRDSVMPNDLRYTRALLCGLSFKPNYTMFFMLQKGYMKNPAIRALWEEFRGRLYVGYPDITLDEISKAAREILENEDSRRAVAR